jgi:hypothetical protein
MDLLEALAIFVRDSDSNAILQVDHICIEQAIHTLEQCLLPEGKVYTRLDAAFDTPEALRQRLCAGGPARA